MHPMTLRKGEIYNDREVATNRLPPNVYRLSEIDAPSLIIHGKLDSLQPFSHGRHAAEQIPGARLIAFERGVTSLWNISSK
jgi:pimeloyl-ACP methyl ester carboxylesterase